MVLLNKLISKIQTIFLRNFWKMRYFSSNLVKNDSYDFWVFWIFLKSNISFSRSFHRKWVWFLKSACLKLPTPQLWDKSSILAGNSPCTPRGQKILTCPRGVHDELYANILEFSINPGRGTFKHADFKNHTQFLWILLENKIFNIKILKNHNCHFLPHSKSNISFSRNLNRK